MKRNGIKLRDASSKAQLFHVHISLHVSIFIMKNMFFFSFVTIVLLIMESNILLNKPLDFEREREKKESTLIFETV